MDRRNLLAKKGDNITLIFNVNEAIKPPNVNIGNIVSQGFDVSGNSSRWEVKIQVTDNITNYSDRL